MKAFEVDSLRESPSVEDRASETVHYGPVPKDFHAEHRRMIRTCEMELAVPLMKGADSVLEIGAGAGWQAKQLASYGFHVHAIDVPESNYTTLREFPVVAYDGKRIPLGDESVDVIFSSNTLEHIPHIVEFQREMQRVLKPGGIAIHIMPTSTWRTWTTASFLLKRGLQLAGFKAIARSSRSSSHRASGRQVSMLRKLRRLFIAPVHGVRGNIVTETLYFTGSFWTNLFRKTGWRVEQVFVNGIFYTGNRVCGPALSLGARRALSKVLGSSCKVYVLRKMK